MRFHLGSVKNHTVYEGELVGMILAVELLRREAGRKDSMALGVDNQAAILATQAFNSKPGHYLMDILHDDLRIVIPEFDRRKLTIRWSPGHCGIPGNEAADVHAKRAARKETSDINQLPTSLRLQNSPIPLPRSKAAAKQQFDAKVKNEAITVMKKSPRYERLRKIDPSVPSKHYANLTAKLSRRHSSLIFQFRTGHAPLNKHLNRINRSTTPKCPRCDREETTHHFLIACPAYARLRIALIDEVGTRARDLKYLLNHPKCIKPTLRFIAKSKRLETIFGDVTPPTDDEEEEE